MAKIEKDKNKKYPAKTDKDKNKKCPAKTDKDKIKKLERFILKKFTLYASIGGYSAGCVIKIPCHKKTLIPKDRYWRERLRDSVVDGCMKPYVEDTLNKEGEL